MRGRYTGSDDLAGYFKAMTYAGRMAFHFTASDATGVTESMAEEQTAAAILMSSLISKDKELSAFHDRIGGALQFIAGRTDDLSVSDYMAAAGAYGPEARARIAEYAKKQNRYPCIVSGLVDVKKLAPGQTAAEATAGFRLFGQAYTAESDMFQRLVYDRVTDYTGKGEPFTMAVIDGKKVRGFPTILDLLLTFGSSRIDTLMAASQDGSYKGYEEAMKEAGGKVLEAVARPATLPEMQLRLAWIGSRDGMESSLNAAAGTWIRGRHNLMLYAKQSYTMTAKSLSLAAPRSRAYVRPALQVYSAIIEDLYLIADRIADNGLKGKIAAFREIMENLRAVAVRQGENGLRKEDFDFLNDLDTTLSAVLEGTDAPVVVDVHTEPASGLVLEEGIGTPLAVEYRGNRGGEGGPPATNSNSP